MATGTIKLMEKRLHKLELKQEFTESDIQSVFTLSNLLSDVSNDFMTYMSLCDVGSTPK